MQAIPPANEYNLNDFIVALKAATITTIICAYRDEWGPAHDQQVDRKQEITYDRQNELRLLAYHNGEILACDLRNRDRHELITELESHGFTVETRSRNWHKFETKGR